MIIMTVYTYKNKYSKFEIDWFINDDVITCFDKTGSHFTLIYGCHLLRALFEVLFRTGGHFILPYFHQIISFYRLLLQCMLTRIYIPSLDEIQERFIIFECLFLQRFLIIINIINFAEIEYRGIYICWKGVK